MPRSGMKKLERIIEQVYAKPWAILPTTHKAIQSVLEAHLAGASFPNWGEADDTEPFTVIGNTAIIPIAGVILNKCSGLESMCGAFSLEDFKANLREAAARADVASIILYISSGGGIITGVPEAADLIAEVAKAKNIYAYTDDICASAAYWLASQCSAVFMSKSAEIGSIGVYLALIDATKAYEMNGEKVELFKAGTFKGMGLDGTSLTDEQRALLQTSVDKSYAEFVQYVTATRLVPKDAMQGQTFSSQDAVKNGLADGIVKDLGSFVDYLNSR